MMTSTSTSPIRHGDFRRAAALLVHFAENRPDGVDALLDEAHDLDALRQLAWCVPALLLGLHDDAQRPLLVSVLHEHAAHYAGLEHDDHPEQS